MERLLISWSAVLVVKAQKCRRFVIAVRYLHETHYRYLVARHLSWRTGDIVKTYTLRWLVEVVIEDLKVHEGWGQATKQPGVDGSRRGLTLSLLCDHCLLLHPEQIARLKHKQPLSTIGSLQLTFRWSLLSPGCLSGSIPRSFLTNWSNWLRLLNLFFHYNLQENI